MIKKRYSEVKNVKTVNEILAECSGKYDALEIYRVENIPNVLWCEAEFIGFSTEEAGNVENELVRDVFLYDEQEYNMAFNEDVNFADMYDKSDAKVLCLCLWKTPKYLEEGIVGYKYNKEIKSWIELKNN